MSLLVAALSWDPQIRGALIVITAFLILCGSVYLLLATNTGAKVGFLIAAAGLTGWMALMCWVWVLYGIGITGDPATWKVKEVVTGDVSELSTVEATDTFPRGWEKLEQGDQVLGDATASADKVLAPSEDVAHGEEEASTEHTFTPVFDATDDYVMVAAYRIGGEDYWLPGGGLATESSIGPKGSNPVSKAINRLKRGPLHKPHFVVIQVGPKLVQPDVDGKPAKPAPDTTKPPTSVVMERDLGSLRVPSAQIALAMTILFAVISYVLHSRDKEIMAAKANPAPAAG